MLVVCYLGWRERCSVPKYKQSELIKIVNLLAFIGYAWGKYQWSFLIVASSISQLKSTIYKNATKIETSNKIKMKKNTYKDFASLFLVEISLTLSQWSMLTWFKRILPLKFREFLLVVKTSTLFQKRSLLIHTFHL